MKLLILLTAIALTSCGPFQKIGAALSTPQAKQVEMSLANIGLKAAVVSGKISPGDALAIGNGVAILTSSDTTMSKVVSLGSLGLDTAADKGIIKPGDAVLIKEVTAVITQAVAPAPPPIIAPIEVTSGK